MNLTPEYIPFVVGGARITADQRAAYYKAQGVYVRQSVIDSLKASHRHRWDTVLHRMVRDCTLLLQNNYGSRLGRFNIHVKTRWHPRQGAGRSWGGWRDDRPFISIAMHRHAIPFDMMEYPSFAHDPLIGYVHTHHREVHLAAIVAHEIAHAAIASMYCNKIGLERFTPAAQEAINKGAHRDGWKAVYGFLRRHYVQRIDAQLNSTAASSIWRNS